MVQLQGAEQRERRRLQRRATPRACTSCSRWTSRRTRRTTVGRRRRRPPDLVVPALRRRALVVHGPRPHAGLVRRGRHPVPHRGGHRDRGGRAPVGGVRRGTAHGRRHRRRGADRRHRAGRARADVRRGAQPRHVHAGRDEGLHGLGRGDGDVERGGGGPDASATPAPPPRAIWSTARWRCRRRCRSGRTTGAFAPLSSTGAALTLAALEHAGRRPPGDGRVQAAGRGHGLAAHGSATARR